MPLFSKLIVFIAIEIVMEKVIKSFVRSYVNFLPLTLALPLMNSDFMYDEFMYADWNIYCLVEVSIVFNKISEAWLFELGCVKQGRVACMLSLYI